MSTQPQPVRNDFETILAITQHYFDGLHTADIHKLADIFHPDVVLKAPGLRRTREQWLALVRSREVPKERGDHYAFKVLSIDIVNDQAMVKVECPLIDQFYIDYLGFLKEDGRWLIVSKMYTAI